MKLLHSVPATNQQTTFYLPKGQFGLFAVEYDLDAATGVTITLADLGNLILTWNGEDLWNVDVEAISKANNLYGGVAKFDAVSGGATRALIFIPAGLWFDSGNIYDIGDNDKVSFKLDFSTLTGKIDSGMIRIYGKPRLGVMNYVHKFIQKSVVSSGAGEIVDVIPVNNVSEIYLKNPAAANVNRLQIQKDGETVIDVPNLNVINEYSDWIHLLESNNNFIAIEFVESRDIREAIGTEIVARYNFTGAGVLQQYLSFVKWTPDKAAESRIRSTQILTNKLSKA